MAKITLKMENAEGMPKTRVKGVDTGHIRSIIPVLLRFLKAIGYDTVIDVQIVMLNGPSGFTMTYGKEGRID